MNPGNQIPLNGQRLWNIFMVTGLEKFQKFTVVYDYSNLITTDFVPQNVPMKPGEEVYITKIFKKPLRK
jgi:hypothetical protein